MKKIEAPRCTGCGRLNGLRSEAFCPCWRAVKDGATVPERLRERVRRAARRGFA